MKKILIAAFAVCTTFLARAQDLKKSPSGASYKIVKAGGGPQVKINDIITFNFIQRTGKDSVLMNSYTNGQPVKIQVTAPQNIADLMDVFPLLSLKDSALVYIPTDSIFKGFEQQRPPFLPAGSSISFSLKIERVQSLEDAMAERTKMMDSLKNEESQTLARYLAAVKPAYTATPSGVLFGITTPSSKPKPVKGDTVFVNYTGSTLDGKVFDSSVQAEAIKAGIEQPGRPYEPLQFTIGGGGMIPGMDEGVLSFNEGSRGFLIIPSSQGYGETGSGAIKPFSALRFDIELVKVKKPVKTIAKPVAKKPVTSKKPVTATKKPVAKAPVKKPDPKK